MEGETGKGDVDSVVAVACGCGGEGATQGLEDEGDDVAGNEDPVVEFGREAGVLRTEVIHAVWGRSAKGLFQVWDQRGEGGTHIFARVI